MTRTISQSFQSAKEQGRAAFMPFVTGCYPDAAASLELIKTLDAGGADLIEVGIPFSDPLADGPVIQRTSTMALEAGVTPQSVLELVEAASQQVSASLVLMTYINPVLAMGMENFAQRAAAAGARGVIIPDLLPEDAQDWCGAAAAHGLDAVFMAAPTTGPARLAAIAQASRGFLYFVSLTGVTGSDLHLDDATLAAIRQARQESPVPVAVGFGISTPEHAAALAPHADGVIVGSALMRLMLDAPSPAEGIKAAATLASQISAALKIG